MALRKCPHCETNYLRAGEEICSVCAASRKKHTIVSVDEVIMCSECGEAPAEEGQELCRECLEEQRRQQDLELTADKIRESELGDEILDEPEEED
ncbi:MAG TPA: hypothetical protein PLM48_06725 [Clostridia bacterium]|jgi:hypothetical protein|nr:hypothetical protein [Clostridia bacterium]